MQDLHEDLNNTEFSKALRRYTELQKLEREIAEEKKQLKDIIYSHLENQKAKTSVIHLDDQFFKVTRNERVTIDYDEKLLQERLGESYEEILSLDLKKIKARESDARACLGATWTNFASPDRNKVKRMVEKKQIDPENFKGAFKKNVTKMVIVARTDPPKPTSIKPF